MAKTIEWTSANGLRFIETNRGVVRTVQIDTISGALHDTEFVTPDMPTARDCQNMIKPVSVRDYDGSIGNGYTTGYLDKYVYTTWEGYGSHPGVDIAGGGVGSGTTVSAIADAHVEQAGWGGSWGNLVILRHDGNNCDGVVFSIYAHMQSTPTVSGDIARNTTLGRVGTTGNSSGAHLHFQIDKNNTSHPY